MTRPRRLALALVSVWLGALLFLTLAATPALFASLPRREAGRVAARMFPAYYAVSLLLPAAALAALFGSGSGRRRRAPLALLGTAVAAAAANALVLRPAIERARVLMDAPGGLDARAAQAFGRLHAASVGIVLLLMALAAAVIVVEILSSDDGAPGPPRGG